MMLSNHFSLAEFTASETATRKGLDNTPESDVVEVMKTTAARMEEVRDILEAPIIISSGYRSPKVNSAIGGSATSQHCKGEAVDFIAPQYGTPNDICHAILDSTIVFDQLIEEGGDEGWVHISFAEPSRRSVLTAHFGGKTTYTSGIA
jgi:hypothetical protein